MHCFLSFVAFLAAVLLAILACFSRVLSWLVFWLVLRLFSSFAFFVCFLIPFPCLYSLLFNLFAWPQAPGQDLTQRAHSQGFQKQLSIASWKAPHCPNSGSNRFLAKVWPKKASFPRFPETNFNSQLETRNLKL